LIFNKEKLTQHLKKLKSIQIELQNDLRKYFLNISPNSTYKSFQFGKDATKNRKQSFGRMKYLFLTFIFALIICEAFSFLKFSFFPFIQKTDDNRNVITSIFAKRMRPKSSGNVEDIITKLPPLNQTLSSPKNSDAKIVFPDIEQNELFDEKALRKSPVGKVIFSVLDRICKTCCFYRLDFANVTQCYSPCFYRAQLV
jgi:hypothetical protein